MPEVLKINISIFLFQEGWNFVLRSLIKFEPLNRKKEGEDSRALVYKEGICFMGNFPQTQSIWIILLNVFISLAFLPWIEMSLTLECCWIYSSSKTNSSGISYTQLGFLAARKIWATFASLLKTYDACRTDFPLGNRADKRIKNFKNLYVSRK